MENLQVTTSFHPEDGVVYGDLWLGRKDMNMN
jgi:hypothetical protein